MREFDKDKYEKLLQGCQGKIADVVNDQVDYIMKEMNEYNGETKFSTTTQIMLGLFHSTIDFINNHVKENAESNFMFKYMLYFRIDVLNILDELGEHSFWAFIVRELHKVIYFAFGYVAAMLTIFFLR